MRNKIIKARRHLKGKGIGIHELLTNHRQYLLEYAKNNVKELSRFMSTWTWDGNVVILVDCDNKGTGKKHTVNSKWEIDCLAKKNTMAHMLRMQVLQKQLRASKRKLC